MMTLQARLSPKHGGIGVSRRASLFYKLFDLKNHLTLVLDTLLNNIESVSEPVLSHKEKESALGVKYRYLKFKGMPQFTGVLRYNQNKTIQFYSITENKNAD